ncbi:SusC/RagA family TonB-linked outer membrane protein [Maribellus comscasis]|uniref:SusC/RagA family TonB-linked outer membrane protein n=2 Tax=Maribellus comscasis TaxID=2681766 RepID=A0A6I6JY28_9BACT|nr:SusC/RagA family TonB-linked outer membrane protein [Maribellus comscasis]
MEENTNFRFFYQSEVLKNKQRINIEFEQKSVRNILDEVLPPLQLKYEVFDNYIAIKSDDGGFSNQESNQEQKSVSGKVTDSSGFPLPGVTVVIKGTTQGTVTDADGKYTIPKVPDDAVLQFSFVGMSAQEVVVGNQTTIDITMQEETIGLEEVVAIGYGTQQKRDLTGSVGSINMEEELSSRPVVDFGQAMYGKIAGVNVINSSGRPGSSSTIQIRGINSISAGSAPLVVVDGIQLPGYDLNSINSADIKSIEILKDASSASIYGSRGANGVILVTTKSGESGKSKLQLNYSFSVQEVIRKMDVMNSYEYAEAAIDAAQNGWIETGGDPNAPNTLDARGKIIYTWPEALEHPETLPNTDWQDVIFRVAPMHKVNLSFSGGNEKSQYLVSGGYINQEGIVITSEYQKYSLNMKFNSEINDWINVGGMLNSIYDHENEPYYRIVEWAVQYPAIYPVYGNNGYLGGPNTVDGFEDYYAVLFRPLNGHPLFNIDEDIQHHRFNTIGNLFAQLDLYEGLSFKTSFNAFYKRVDNTDYYPKDHNMGPAYYRTATFKSNTNRTISYTWENLLTYDKTLGNHSFTILGGYEYNFRDYYWLQAERRDYDNDDIHYLTAGKTIYGAGDDANQTTLISLLGRVNYSFAGKYLISASFRRDGSSRFGPNSKWGNFPSFALGWRASEESFMKSISALSNLKIRASYGFTGNDNFSDYSWISQMNQAKVAIGDNLQTSYYPSNIENPDLAWERTKQINLGLDLGLFEQRISIETDFYNTVSDNLLLAVPVPSTSGFTSVFSNIGKLRNNGFEFNLTSHNINSRLKWTTQLNFALNRSEVMELGPDNAPMIYSVNSFGTMQKINKVGEPLFSFYGYKYDGVYMNQAEIDADPTAYATATPGDGRYVDVTGDGILNSDDRTIIGNYEPDFTWGITNSFSYENFDLSFLIQGSVGGEIYNDDAHRSMLYHEGRNYLGELTNRWRSEEDPGDGYHYKLTVNIDGYEKTASSYWLDDATYVRLKDLTIGYNLPKKISSSIGLSNARVFFNGVNLFTIADAPVYDPENFVRHSGFSDPVNRGVGGSSYPSAKIYSFGVNVEF